MQNDRYSYIGLFLIGAILFGWMYFNHPSQKELARQKAVHDSIAQVEKQHEKLTAMEANAAAAPKTTTSATPTDTTGKADSTALVNSMKNDYGIFYPALKGTPANTTLENDLLKITLSAQGGKITSVLLKKFKTASGKPLTLFFPDSTKFGLILNAYSRFLSTDSLYFTAKDMPAASNGDSSSVAMRLNTSNPAKYLEYIYTLKKGSYMVGCTLHVAGLNDVLASNSPEITLHWAMNTPTQEKDIKNQQRISTVYFKYAGDEVDDLSPMKAEKKALRSAVNWVSFKQQFFSSVLIADSRFGSPEVSSANDAAPGKVKSYDAMLSIPYYHKPDESFGMRFYFGPNNFKLLKHYSENGNLQLQRLVNLGWGIFGWVNRFLVIPIFDFLSRFNLNYGLVILILTLIIKALLFPIAFRSYLSAAKMRLLKPEMDELGKKFPKKEEAMKKQQAIMALYKKAGVSPMAGCLPMVFQLPILYALFDFFPASIELRQKSFLWAHDLSTYDTAIKFHHFSLPFLGDHISMFALLMTGSQYLYLTVNQQLMGGPGADQMKSMKWMMYLMPVIFLGVLNSYSAGLSYYYFLANLITFGQTYLARLFINEDQLHRKMQANKAKVAKPSRFQQRLEKVMKEQQARTKRR